MNGAEAVLSSLADAGVTACFSNPGTSEMQMVAAFDREPRIRPILCLFEGVATGAADGFGRLASVPAATLLHLGPGLLNGGANLHNARRARTPIVNVVGDHATDHRRFDAPLTSDIAALAGPLSVWVGSPESPEEAVALAVACVARAQGPVSGPATLILPADCAWSKVKGKAEPLPREALPTVSSGQAEHCARRLRAASRPVLLLGSAALSEGGLAAASRISAAGVRILIDTFVSRQPRGAGRFVPDRLLYFGEMALADLEGVDLIILAGTQPPVAFFAYPGKPSLLVPEGCVTESLASAEQDVSGALEELAEAMGGRTRIGLAKFHVTPLSAGELTAYSIGDSIARHMPENSVVSDDAVTAGLPIYMQTREARPHDWLMLTGGAIGQGIPLSIGAALARPDIKVLSLNGDGAAAYTSQGLWTIAREELDIITIIFANRAYRILNIELARTGAGQAGERASRLLDLSEPALDWRALAEGYGLPAVRVESAEGFDSALQRALARGGPSLIEATLP